MLVARSLRSRVLVATLALLAGGCSWSRFSDVTEDTPIVRLERPDNMNTGFGVTLATGTLDGRSLLLVGGEPGTSPAGLFDLGKGDAPNLATIDSHFCDNTQGKCFLGSSMVYLPHTVTSAAQDRRSVDSCVALGLGKPNFGDVGVFFECQDRTAYSRPVIPAYEDDVDFALTHDQNETIAVAGDGADDPLLVVGAPAALTTGRAWFYAPGTDEPIELKPPQKTADGYGTRVAAVPLGSAGWLMAVSAPNAGDLHLFRTDGTSPTYLGCLGGMPGFGRTLTTGSVSGAAGGSRELVVGSYDSIFVFDTTPLAALPEAHGVSCTLAALPAGTLRNSFGCGSTKDTGDCSSSDFGASLAVADLDGDLDGEVLVGAPQMAVFGTHGVGAVLVYDIDQPGDGALSDVRFVASGKGGDALGGSVAAGSVGGRDVIVAGEPHSGQVSLHYCSSLVPPTLVGARCE
jgi:hypothetical protein